MGLRLRFEMATPRVTKANGDEARSSTSKGLAFRVRVPSHYKGLMGFVGYYEGAVSKTVFSLLLS